jgi:hypothetical protein
MREATVILPTEEFFPDAYDGTEPAVRTLLDRVGGYMGVAAGGLGLGFYSEANRPALIDADGRPVAGTAGRYQEGEKPTIWIETSYLDDPMALVATMAHELGHVLLLGGGRITHDTEDQELLTDVLTVFLGLGLFTANATVREAYWRHGHWEGWTIGRHGYMTQPMYGYALALFAYAREEEDPDWARHLRLDVRAPLKKGLRYLLETGDSVFK